MTGLQDMDFNLRRQYTSAYGPFAAGDYAIGEQLRGAAIRGTVIWSYLGAQGLTYVVDDTTGWPCEVLARSVIGR